MPHKTPRLIDYGDSAILVQYDIDGFSKDINQRIHSLSHALRQSSQWREIVPGYDSLLCVFDLSTTTADQAKKSLLELTQKTTLDSETAGNIIEIPVVYGGDYGPDMEVLKKSRKLTEKAIIKLHSSQIYDVCMMGFIPGFCFLSEAPEKLHHPRHASPRENVPAGSIGIAGWQTGIYGLSSPGGWQIIGQTPLKIFDAARDDPFLVKAGDKIKFVPIDPEFFEGFSND